MAAVSQDHRRVPPVRRCNPTTPPRRCEQRPSRNGAGGGPQMERIRATLVAIAVLVGVSSAGAVAPLTVVPAGAAGSNRALFGVGRDAGPNCLGGAYGDNRYWSYFRAPAGTSTYTYSRAGAGSTQVH